MKNKIKIFWTEISSPTPDIVEKSSVTSSQWYFQDYCNVLLKMRTAGLSMKEYLVCTTTICANAQKSYCACVICANTHDNDVRGVN
jgi:hypothetical protein